MNLKPGPGSAASRPSDIVDLLEQNGSSGRALFEGAMLYRGTTTPVQSTGLLSDTVMHASPSAQVAASYTHATADRGGYIGAYPISESTRFFKDWGMEEQLKGKAEGLSLKEAETLLKPYVASVLNAATPQARDQARATLREVVNEHLHEATLPASELNKGVIHYYSGQVKEASSRAVIAQMTPVTEANSAKALADIKDRFRDPNTAGIRELAMGSQTQAVAHSGVAGVRILREALFKMETLSQSQFKGAFEAQTKDMALPEALDAARNFKPTGEQQKIGQLAAVINEAMNSPDKNQAGLALLAASKIRDMPASASYRELCSAMSSAAREFNPPKAVAMPKEASSTLQAQPARAAGGGGQAAQAFGSRGLR